MRYKRKDKCNDSVMCTRLPVSAKAALIAESDEFGITPSQRMCEIIVDSLRKRWELSPKKPRIYQEALGEEIDDAK